MAKPELMNSLLETLTCKYIFYISKKQRWPRSFAVFVFITAFLGNFHLGSSIAPLVAITEEVPIIKAGESLHEINMNTNHGKALKFQGIKKSGQVTDEAQADKLMAKGINLNGVENPQTLKKTKIKTSLTSFFKSIKDRIKKIMRRVKKMFNFFGNKNLKKSSIVKERTKLVRKVPEQEIKSTKKSSQYLEEDKDYYENLNKYFQKPPDVNEFKKIHSFLKSLLSDEKYAENFAELLHIYNGIFDDEGKIIAKYSRDEFEDILRGFGKTFSGLKLTGSEAKIWREVLALVAFQVIDIKTIGAVDSPNKYFREIMSALLINSKTEPDSGMSNISRYIYQKVLTDKIAEVHLAGKDISYELSRIEMRDGHFFFGDRNLEISGDTAILTTQAKENKLISEGIKLFGSPGMKKQKSVHLKKLIQAISREEIFGKEEERFLAFKFIKWAHGKESDAIVRKEIEYKIACLALDSFLLLPSTHSNLKTSAETANNLLRTIKKNSYKFSASSNEKFSYPDLFSAGISPFEKDIKSYKKNNHIQRKPYQKSFWLDSTLMARALFETFEKTSHIGLLKPSEIKIILMKAKTFQSFEKNFDNLSRNQEFIFFLNRYETAQPEDQLELIKYALLKSRSINTKMSTDKIPSLLKSFTNFFAKSKLEHQKILWLRLVSEKLQTFNMKSDYNGFIKLITEFAPQIDSMRNEVKNSRNLKALIGRVESFLKQIAKELISGRNTQKI
ncbi:expressed protein [Phakopsora pachyrhizi]|uniref:Expressed protein n=1 Tax=Phakopsora pachyrhizi TaxID=170000 RepID=A0AAV0BGY6_PHAPC|nr:expressed protein [Phakopsora pachyrhizi]